MTLTSLSRIDEALRVLEHVDRIPLPGTTWALVDYLDKESGDLKVVVDLGNGEYIETLVEETSKLQTLTNVVRRKLRLLAKRDEEAHDVVAIQS